MIGPALDHLPKDPPRDPDVLPGLRWRHGVPRGAAFVLVPILGFLALMAFLIVSEDRSARLTFGETTTIGATVTGVEEGVGCGVDGAIVSFEFADADGFSHQGTEAVCRNSPYRGVGPGAAVPVEYLPSDPSVHGIVGEAGAGAGVFIILGFLLLIAAFFILPVIGPQVRRLLGDRRRFKHGALTRARVVYVRGAPAPVWSGWPTDGAAEVYVQFESESGERLEARARSRNSWLVSQLETGSVVHIAYDPRKPSRATLLEEYVR